MTDITNAPADISARLQSAAQQAKSRPGRKPDLARHAAIKAAFDSGMERDEISAQLGLARGTVNSYATRYRQQTRDEGTRHSAEKNDQQQLVFDRLIGMFERRPTIMAYEPFGGPQGDTTLWYKHAGCAVNFHVEAEGDYKPVTAGDLMAKGQRYHIIDIDPYGFFALWFMDIHVANYLYDTGALFITFPKIALAQGKADTIWKCQQALKIEGRSWTIEDVKSWLIDGVARDYRQIEFMNIVDIGNMWRIGCVVRRVNASTFLPDKVI